MIEDWKRQRRFKSSELGTRNVNTDRQESLDLAWKKQQHHHPSFSKEEACQLCYIALWLSTQELFMLEPHTKTTENQFHQIMHSMHHMH